jgi:DNA-binding LacI/PurR family transcriptional regulator
MASTSQDVAKLAGVSIATISRVINGYPHVSATVRRKVLRAVKTLNYQPNRTAQRLRAKRSRVVGLIISDIQNPFFTSVVRGIEDLAYQQGYSVVLCNSDEDPQKEHLYIDVMCAEDVAGVIIASASEASAHVQALLDRNIPVIAIDRRVRSRQVDSVLVANVQGTIAAMSHLLSMGHREIGYVGLPLDRTPGRERYAGYRRALRAHGLKASRGLVCFGNAKQQGGYECAARLLKANPSLTAFFVANNLMTLGALGAIQEAGLKIPADVSVVGFDDMPWAPLLQPPLTVVAQPTYELGQKAVELLLARIKQPDKPVTHVELNPTLIPRASTGPSSRANTSDDAKPLDR